MLSKSCIEGYLKRRANYAYDLSDTSVALDHLLEENGIEVDFVDSIFSASTVEEENDKIRFALGKKLSNIEEVNKEGIEDRKSKVLDIADKKLELIKKLYFEIDSQITSLNTLISEEIGLKTNLENPVIGDVIDELQEVYDDIHS